MFLSLNDTQIIEIAQEFEAAEHESGPAIITQGRLQCVTRKSADTSSPKCWLSAVRHGTLQDMLRRTSQHQSASEETEENKKSLKIVMFDSQVSISSQSVTGFGKEKEGTFKNLGLVAAQCNGIAA